MLDEKTLEAHFDRLGIPPEGRVRIRWIRENSPVRAVGGGTKNTPCRFASNKMKFVLEAEAFNTEYAAFEEFENDESVSEFYGQPCLLKIVYTNANGKTVHPDITPDIFVITQSYFAFIECKTEDDLLKLAQAQPERYSIDGGGRWRSPAGELAAAKIGCKFIVRSSKDNNWIALENYEFFADYLFCDPDELVIAPDALSKIDKRLADSSWLTAGDLIHGADPIDSDSLYGLIATRKVYFDFLTNRISDPEQALIFRDKIAATAYRTIARTSVGLKTPSVTPLEWISGRRFAWDGKPWQVVNVGDEAISAMPLDSEQPAIIELDFDSLSELARGGKIVPVCSEVGSRSEAVDSILLGTCADKLATANSRYEILFGKPKENNPLLDTKARAIAYWLANYRAAEFEFGVGLIGLIPNRKGTQGNHKRKCDPHAISIAEAVYQEYWETHAQRSAVLCHGIYATECERQGVAPLSLRSFNRIIVSNRSHLQTKSRIGEKAAYNEEPPYLVLEYTTPRHGNRPFHIGHIDHTPLPIVIKDKSGKKKLDSIWMTILIDAYSRYVLAVYFSFDPPSYVSCMMVIRECVRRHGRIPRWIIVDNGSDFQSVYFETLIGRLRSHKRDRPKGKAKYGSLVERVFLTTMEQFISNLLGATHDMNPRQIGRDVDPQLKAIWTYERLYVRFQEYLAKVYHRNVHGTLGQTPEEAFVQGQQTFGSRRHTIYSFTETFIILTCPSTPKGSAKVTPKGVKINYLYYRCAAMDLPGVLDSRLDVRYDPANYGVAYVLLRGTWQKCYSEYYAIFQTYTERQIRISTNHLRVKAKMLGKQITINSQNLAAFLLSAEADEVLNMQRLHDAESQTVKAVIKMPTSGELSAPISEAPECARPIIPSPVPTLLEDF